jgi:hypothetical protein
MHLFPDASELFDERDYDVIVATRLDFTDSPENYTIGRP